MMIVLFSIYMIFWPILFVFCMDCIYQVVQDILKEVREINKLRAAPTSPAPTDADDVPHPRPPTEQEIEDGKAVWCSVCTTDCHCPYKGKDLLCICGRFKESEAHDVR